MHNNSIMYESPRDWEYFHTCTYSMYRYQVSLCLEACMELGYIGLALHHVHTSYIFLLLCRFAYMLPAGWVFIMMCLLLKLTEGIGSSLFLTGALSIAPQYYPKSVGTVTVSIIISKHQFQYEDRTSWTKSTFSIPTRVCWRLLLG